MKSAFLPLSRIRMARVGKGKQSDGRAVGGDGIKRGVSRLSGNFLLPSATRNWPNQYVNKGNGACVEPCNKLSDFALDLKRGTLSHPLVYHRASNVRYDGNKRIRLI